MGRKAVSYLLYHLAIAFTAGMLVLAAICRHASFVSPEQGRIWMQLAFVTPLVLLVNGILFVTWLALRRWLLALLPLAAFVVNRDFVSAMIQPPGRDGAARAELTVATLNVHAFSEYKPRSVSVEAIASLMRRNEVDVVCFQEFRPSKEEPLDSIVHRFSGFLPYHAVEGSVAVFSRYPILDREYHLFADSGNSCLRADVAFRQRTVRVICVHLQTTGIAGMRRRYLKDYGENMPAGVLFDLLEENGRIRARQARAVREIIDRSPMPLVLAGDFNDLPSSYTYRTLSEGLNDGFRKAGSGYGGTYRYMKGLLRIDYIFYNDFFEGSGYRVLDDRVSDHKAVIAGLRLRE